jgi:general secretion pathway protein F/type IV pilus assembly protein PilC
MKYYRYKLIAPTGQVSSGVIKLPYHDIMSAITHLERDGSVTIFVKYAGPILSALHKLSNMRLHRRIKRPVLAEMLNNISVMLRAGLALVSALKESAASADVPEVQGDMNDLVMSIQGGASFSKAASNYPHIFPATVIHLIRMGEETGQLDNMAADASTHLKRVHEIMTDTRQALLYPSIVFAIMGGGMIFWFYYVVPKIVGLFQEMEVVLPPLTLFLIALSEFIRNHLAAVLGGVILVFMLVQGGRRYSRKFKGFTDLGLLKLPIAKTLIKASNLAFITEYFSMLLNAGIDILQSLQIIIESVGNEVYREKLMQVKASITKGEGISDSFKNADIFPAFVARMINVGEMSGSLTEQLDYIAQEYRKKLNLLVASLGKMLEPLVLIVAGSFFAVIIIALLLPIYDLISQVAT